VSDDAPDESPTAAVDTASRDEKIQQAKSKIDDAQSESDPAQSVLKGRKQHWWHRHLESEERHRILAELGDLGFRLLDLLVARFCVDSRRGDRRNAARTLDAAGPGDRCLHRDGAVP